MRHICDVHLELPGAVRHPRDIHRVVEVLSRLAVDGNDGQMPEILPRRQVPLADRVRHLACFGQHFVGKLVRQVVLADDDLDVHAELAWPAQDLHHAPGRRHPASRVTSQLDIHHRPVEFGQARPARAAARALRDWPRPTALGVAAELLAQLGSELLAGWDDDLVQQARIVGQHNVAAVAIAKKPYDCWVRALQDAHDAAFDAARGLAIRTGDAAAASCGPGAALDAREHVVTVHGVAQGVAADKQIALHPWDRFIRHDEAIAVAMRHQPTGEQVGIMQFLSRFSVPRNGCCGRRCSWFGKPSSVPLRRASDGAAFLPARRKRPLWTSSISPLRFRRETIFCSARRPWWRNSSAWAISRKLAGSRARARCAITSWSVNSSSLRIGRRHCTGFAASKRRQLFSRRRVERGRPTQTAPVHPQRTRRRPTPGTQRGGGTTWTASFLFFWELGKRPSILERERGATMLPWHRTS